MTRFLAALAALFLAAPAAAEVRTVPVTDFDRVVVEGPFQVRLARGPVTRAAVTGARGAIDAVSVESQGQTLRIRGNPNRWGGNPGRRAEPAIVTLTTRSLRSVRVIGAGSVEIEGARGMRLDLAVEGDGRISGAGLQVDRLVAGLRGAGAMALAGTAEALILNVQGAGSVDARALAADTATLTASSSGVVAITAAREAIVTASGLGAVDVHGAAPCTLRGATAGIVRCASAR